MSVFGTFLRLFSEQRSKRMTWDDLTRKLERAAGIVLPRFDGKSDSPANLEAARHVIGIERWAQQRLRSAQGEPPVIDEYDGYRPDDLATMQALKAAFADTRRETVAIIQQLRQAGVPLDATTPHNELGELTIGGWVLYLTDHAWRETLIMRN